MLRPDDKIVITHVYPPIPDRQFDWSATWSNDEPDEEGHWRLIGYGPRPLDAIVDLLDCTEDYEDGRQTPPPKLATS